MATRLTIIAKKGGVGKTTLAMAIAGYFATNGARVLLVDLDAQGSATENCLTKEVGDQLPGDQTIAALFDDEMEVEPEDIIHKSHLENIWIVPANYHFEGHLDPRPLEAEPWRQVAVADLLAEVEERFDWVILDSPPALGNLGGWNCLTAAHYAVSPVQMEGYSAQKVVGVEQAIGQALSRGNRELKFLGYIVNEFDGSRKKDHAPAEEALRARYNEQVFDTVVMRRAAIPQAQNADQHICATAPKSQEAKTIGKLANEITSRIEKAMARRAA